MDRYSVYKYIAEKSNLSFREIDILDILNSNVRINLDVNFMKERFLVIDVKFVDDTLMGYFLVSDTGNFRKINLSNFSLFFGFEFFKDYNYGDEVYFVEGLKDWFVMRRYFKHVIAYLSATINSDLLNFFKSVTNKIYVACDSDKYKYLKNIYNDLVVIDVGVKDVGEFIFDDFDVKNIIYKGVL